MYGIYRYAMILAAAMVSAVAAAQNLDPTVEVSRAYEGNLVEVHKPTLEMSVPDSVQRFRLDFDYSVFDSPYKGSYEFNPVADIIWSPALKKGFKMNLYASHRSYIGDYRTIEQSGTNGELVRSDVAEPWKGADSRTDAGICGTYDWRKGAFSYDLAYLGIHSKDYIMKTRAFNGVNASMNVVSKAARTFVYDVDLDYRFAADKGLLNENYIALAADLGPQFKLAHRILFDIGAEMALYSTVQDWSSARMHFTPHYVYKKGRWHIDAGVRVDFLVATDNDAAPRSVERQQIVYPDVHVEFTAIRNAMNIYAEATGGNRINTYGDVVRRNHFADTAFFDGTRLDATVERVNAALGLKGRIGTRFSYNIKGGYAGYANAMFDALYQTPGANPTAGIGYSHCSKAYASLEWILDTERFRFDGTAGFAHYWGFEDIPGLFKPSSVTGDVSIEYNIRKRIFFGVDCEYASARKTVMPVADSLDFVIPGYADLGVNFEWVTSRKLSLWARGGNLLNMTIQRTPLYAQGGISFTVGICLNL